MTAVGRREGFHSNDYYLNDGFDYLSGVEYIVRATNSYRVLSAVFVDITVVCFVC